MNPDILHAIYYVSLGLVSWHFWKKHHDRDYVWFIGVCAIATMLDLLDLFIGINRLVFVILDPLLILGMLWIIFRPRR